MFQRCMHRQWIGTMWNGINHTVKRLYSLISNINLSAINPPSLDVNRALKRSAWYSRGSAGREATLAVDGNYNPSTTFCIDTGNMDYPWWAVEMDSLLEVDRVVVIASGGCYSIWCIICLLLFCHHIPMDSCKLFNSAPPPGQNGRRFPDDIFRRIFVNENVCVLIKILHTFVPKGQINTNAAFFQIIAWLRIDDKPLSEAIVDPKHWRKYAALGGNELTLSHRNAWLEAEQSIAYAGIKA